MSIEAAKELIAKLDSQINDGDLGMPHFRDSEIEVFPLGKENFRRINAIGGSSQRKLAFVDGGNLEIIGAPNFSIQLNRIYAGIWENNNRVVIDLPRVEFFSAILSSFKDEALHYTTILVPSSSSFSHYLPDAADLNFSSKERTLLFGQRADIQLMAAIARNFAEWRYATLLTEHLGSKDILVMDGSLQTGYQNESRYLKELFSLTSRKEIDLCGLSKTSSLHTTTAMSLLGAVNKLASDSGVTGEWFHPIFQSTAYNLYSLVAKFHPSSERVFRIDVPKNQFEKHGEDNLNLLLGELASNSCDATFPGYPYGLIDADLFSRVSENEKEYYRAIISSEISGQNKRDKFLPHIRAKDAHDVLNLIAGF
ncbi:MAG: DNA double-strand break repair nuclease NurA [Nitrososphaerales archaeon]